MSFIRHGEESWFKWALQQLPSLAHRNFWINSVLKDDMSTLSNQCAVAIIWFLKSEYQNPLTVPKVSCSSSLEMSNETIERLVRCVMVSVFLVWTNEWGRRKPNKRAAIRAWKLLPSCESRRMIIKRLPRNDCEDVQLFCVLLLLAIFLDLFCFGTEWCSRLQWNT